MLTIVDDILKKAARTIDFSQIMRHIFRTQLSHNFSNCRISELGQLLLPK